MTLHKKQTFPGPRIVWILCRGEQPHVGKVSLKETFDLLTFVGRRDIVDDWSDMLAEIELIYWAALQQNNKNDTRTEINAKKKKIMKKIISQHARVC